MNESMVLNPEDNQSLTIAYTTNPRPCNVSTQVDEAMLNEGADLFRSMSMLGFDDDKDLRNSEVPRQTNRLDISIESGRSERQEGMR